LGMLPLLKQSVVMQQPTPLQQFQKLKEFLAATNDLQG